MYRKTFYLVERCPNVMTRNHLVSTCEHCSGAVQYGWQKTTRYLIDREYCVYDRKFEQMCLRWAVNKGMNVLTNVEACLPILKYQSIRRIPTMYDCRRNSVLDLFDIEKKERFSGYFLKYLIKYFEQMGIGYVQYGIDYKQRKIITLNKHLLESEIVDLNKELKDLRQFKSNVQKITANLTKISG